MSVTKYDLQFFANNYFVVTLTEQKHTISADDCHTFLFTCFGYVMDIPTRGQEAYDELINYIIAVADYYGFDIKKVISYAKEVGADEVYFLYMKENFDISADIDVQEFIKDVFKEIGETVGGSIWALIKPLIPIFLLGLAAIYATKKVMRSN